jgi:flagellar hook assembly protein FlgD
LNFDPVVSLTETSAEVAISNVYPNPSTGETSIDYTLANAGVVNLNVTDLTGKVIYTINEGTVAEGTHAVSFDAANFANGVYYVTLTAGESVVTQKFIKK